MKVINLERDANFVCYKNNSRDFFFLRPQKPQWGFSRSPAKPSFMNPTLGVSCYAVPRTMGIFKGFACHTTSIQWIIWGVFCSCQKSVPVWHSTKEKKAVHKRAAENREGMWIKREIFQNMPLEKTAKDADPFCSFTKDVNMLSKLKEQKSSLFAPKVFLWFCYRSWTRVSKTTINESVHTHGIHQTYTWTAFTAFGFCKDSLQNSLP